MHGLDWDQSSCLTGWWLSEKMDGIRAYWDGFELLSRQGNIIRCPAWFTGDVDQLQPLRGELFMGRPSSSHNLLSIIASRHNSDRWERVGYYIHDIPSHEGASHRRVERLARLCRLFPAQGIIVQ